MLTATQVKPITTHIIHTEKKQNKKKKNETVLHVLETVSKSVLICLKWSKSLVKRLVFQHLLICLIT